MHLFLINIYSAHFVGQIPVKRWLPTMSAFFFSACCAAEISHDFVYASLMMLAWKRTSSPQLGSMFRLEARRICAHD